MDSAQNLNDHWLNLQELIDCGGAINIGYLDRIGRAAVATQDRQVYAQLRVGGDESLVEIFDRLDVAVAGAVDEGIVVDEINR